MAKRQWSVEIGFNRFDGCPKKHKAWQVCDGCREHQGVMQMKVPASDGTLAAWCAVQIFGESAYFSAGYQAVTVTLDGESTERLPPLPSPLRAASQKPRSPREPKGSTASTKGSAQKRGGKGQRKQ